MTCDFCNKKEAAVHLSEMINGEARELHLCEPCAKEKGITAAQGFGLGEMLAGMAEIGTKKEKAAPKPTCRTCGCTYDDFRKSGRLGCGACYDTFRRYLTPLLRRVHGSSSHVGKKPPEGKPKASRPRETLATLREK